MQATDPSVVHLDFALSEEGRVWYLLYSLGCPNPSSFICPEDFRAAVQEGNWQQWLPAFNPLLSGTVITDVWTPDRIGYCAPTGCKLPLALSDGSQIRWLVPGKDYTLLLVADDFPQGGREWPASWAQHRSAECLSELERFARGEECYRLQWPNIQREVLRFTVQVPPDQDPCLYASPHTITTHW